MIFDWIYNIVALRLEKKVEDRIIANIWRKVYQIDVLNEKNSILNKAFLELESSLTSKIKELENKIPLNETLQNKELEKVSTISKNIPAHKMDFYRNK